MAGHSLESVGLADREPVIKPARDAHEQNLRWGVFREQLCRACSGSHGAEAAEFQPPCYDDRRQKGRGEHITLEHCRYENQRWQHGILDQRGEIGSRPDCILSGGDSQAAVAGPLGPATGRERTQCLCSNSGSLPS